jgi:hypothetical protein
MCLQEVLAREVWLLVVTRYSVDDRMRSYEVGVILIVAIAVFCRYRYRVVVRIVMVRQ